MATLFRRSGGIYYIVDGPRGRRRWKSTGERNKKAAHQKLIEYLTQGEPSPVQPPEDIRLLAFQKEFMKYAQGTYSPGTAVIYKTTLQHFIKYFGNRTLSSIQSRDIDAYRIERLRQVSPVTVNLELRMLRAAFYTALRWKFIPENPFRKVRMARVPEQTPVYFTKEEFQMLYDRIREPWLKDLVVVAVMTGLRRGELIDLTWKSVDFGRKIINIESTETFRTKTGKKRIVPMNEVVLEVLKRRRSAFTCEHVFSVRKRRVEKGTVTHLFKTYVRKLGINPKLHFHSLRHTFATWLVQDGVSIYHVQKLMGHSSVPCQTFLDRMGVETKVWFEDIVGKPRRSHSYEPTENRLT